MTRCIKSENVLSKNIRAEHSSAEPVIKQRKGVGQAIKGHVDARTRQEELKEPRKTWFEVSRPCSRED